MGNQFWLLRSPDVPPKAQWDDGKVALETVTCPADPGIEWHGKRFSGAHQRPGRRLNDLAVVLSNNPPEDFVWTWYGECLLQDHLLGLLRQQGFSGFEVKPVIARFEHSSERWPRLWELILTGWAGMAKPESGIRLDETESCMICGNLRYTGLTDAAQLIDESKWDGSDFFMVWPMPKFVFVTERVVTVIRKPSLDWREGRAGFGFKAKRGGGSRIQPWPTFLLDARETCTRIR
jgi:hypothetical protein